MRLLAFLLAFFLALPAAALPAEGKRGMVATAHPAATEAGVAMLRQGGNAVDAIVASAFTLAVVEPYSSGIGGGGFALLRFGEELRFFDFREVAPAKATRDMFLRDGKPAPELSRDGILSVAVPGAVAGYVELHERFGKLPRRKVMAPAIAWAKKGFVVDERYRNYARWRLDVLAEDPEAARLFLHRASKDAPWEVPPMGHRIVQRDLAATLEAIAARGAKGFYAGKVASKLAADMKARGGLVDEADLARYRVREREPLIGAYRGHLVATAPPPSAGGQVVLATLAALETLPADRSWRDPEALHVFIETLKRVYADRALIGDPDFVDVPLSALVDPARGKKLAAAAGKRATPSSRIRPGEGTSLQTDAEPLAPAGGMDTTHLSVIDAAGNAVSMTTTVNYGFGSGVVARGTGVLWNDEMDDFAIAPGVPNVYGVVGSSANAVAPGKVPLSSMSPTIILAGPTPTSPVRLIVGTPGGSRIPTMVIQTIVAHLDFGADVQQAVSAGRIHHQHLPDVVAYENFALDDATIRALQARGHKLERGDRWGNANAIAVDPKTGVRTGAADPRGVGTAMAE